MRLIRFQLVSVLLGTALAHSGAAETTAYENGFWFDGETFVSKPMYVENGLFVEPPASIARTVDLLGGYVVPPFAEAHNHNVSAGADEMIARYIKEGIFYVKNPNSLPSDRAERETFNTPASIDVVFANGGLTATNGHPIQIAQRNIDNGYWSESDGEGGFYHTIDSMEAFSAKWPAILAGKPDFLKTYLLYSEEHAERRDSAEHKYWKGLDPDLLEGIVSAAHAEGLRVSTHVETAADFRAAVAAGVDEINHLPGFRPQPGYPLSTYALSGETAQRAADQGTVVVTTVANVHPEDVREMIRRNLQTLQQQGVKLAIGSDAHETTATFEVMYLRRLEVFSDLELLKMWCEVTPQAIFPTRRIGLLAPGYEASFLVLEGDPLADFRNTRRIVRRVKQGVELD